MYNAKIWLASYAVHTPHEFTNKGEQSVSQSHNYPAKRGVRPNPREPGMGLLDTHVMYERLSLSS